MAPTSCALQPCFFQHDNRLVEQSKMWQENNENTVTNRKNKLRRTEKGIKHIKNEKWERIYEEKNRKKDIVGGFNPFEKSSSK